MRAIEDFNEPGAYDLVFTNAALQWVGDHKKLFGRLMNCLTANGQLAVQMPANDDYRTHTTAAEIASEEPFRTVLNGYVRPRNVLQPEEYSELLDVLGCREQHVRLQVYGHHLESRVEVIEWVRGTLLTDYQSRMPAETFELFLERYREALLPRLKDSKPYFYPFKRILLWGRR